LTLSSRSSRTGALDGCPQGRSGRRRRALSSWRWARLTPRRSSIDGGGSSDRRGSSTAPSTLEKLKVGCLSILSQPLCWHSLFVARFSELLCNLAAVALDLVRFSASLLPSFLPPPQSLLLVMLLLQYRSRDQLQPESSDEVKKISTEVAPPATLSQAPPTSRRHT